jgi:hypothetical protein
VTFNRPQAVLLDQRGEAQGRVAVSAFSAIGERCDGQIYAAKPWPECRSNSRHRAKQPHGTAAAVFWHHVPDRGNGQRHHDRSTKPLDATPNRARVARIALV